MPVNLSLAPLTPYLEQVSENVLPSPSVLWKEARMQVGGRRSGFQSSSAIHLCLGLGFPILNIGLIISASFPKQLSLKGAHNEAELRKLYSLAPGPGWFLK